MPGEEATSQRGLAAAALLAALVAGALFAYLAWLRPSQTQQWGDEGTSLAMTASLARDFDLEFAEVDRQWALERGGDKGVALILQRTEGRSTETQSTETQSTEGQSTEGQSTEHQNSGGRVTYSKPPLYPFIAAVPYKLRVEPGMRDRILSSSRASPTDGVST